MQSTNRLSYDKPFGFALPVEAVGTPVDMWFLKCTLGNINLRRTWLPVAFTATISVIFISLSLAATLSNYSIPLAQIIFGGK
jgi:hypothetical protein